MKVCNRPDVAVWLLAALFYFSSSPLPIGFKNAFSSLLRERTRYGAGTTEVRRRYEEGATGVIFGQFFRLVDFAVCFGK